SASVRASRRSVFTRRERVDAQATVEEPLRLWCTRFTRSNRPSFPDPLGRRMLVLYSYPTLFGVADNNGYGLKGFAFLRLTGVPFRHEHIFDASQAPRGQLPYIVDDGRAIGDSDTIIAYLISRDRLTIDAALTAEQRDESLLIARMLDDLYWVMSYSRW